MKNKIKSTSYGNTAVNKNSHFSISTFSSSGPKTTLPHNTTPTGTLNKAKRYHRMPTMVNLLVHLKAVFDGSSNR
jgi:hypothetical protein